MFKRKDDDGEGRMMMMMMEILSLSALTWFFRYLDEIFSQNLITRNRDEMKQSNTSAIFESRIRCSIV